MLFLKVTILNILVSGSLAASVFPYSSSHKINEIDGDGFIDDLALSTNAIFNAYSEYPVSGKLTEEDSDEWNNSHSIEGTNNGSNSGYTQVDIWETEAGPVGRPEEDSETEKEISHLTSTGVSESLLSRSESKREENGIPAFMGIYKNYGYGFFVSDSYTPPKYFKYFGTNTE